MKALPSFLMILVTTAAPLHANGGGYFRGGLKQAGDLLGFEPHATEKIRMVDEQLLINLRQKEAGVEIQYLMRNETDQKVKIRFGFPVEELSDRDLMGEPLPALPVTTDKLEYCQDYSVTARNKPLDSKWQKEEKPAEDKRFKGISGWLVSELTFRPHEEIPVTIRFRSGYASEYWSVSENTSASAAIFRYRLSTAAVWAGTIGNGRVVLKPDGIPAADLKVIRPANRFKKEGDQWVWDFKDLEPTLDDDFEVEAVPEIRTYNSENANTTYIERGGKWGMAHSNYAVTASSTLPSDGNLTYVADHLKEYYGEEAWSEGAKGPGIGEWLELKPEVAKPLTGIGIKPGYNKDDLFKANARPKKIQVELNGEHRFSANIPDSPDEFVIPVTGYKAAVKTVKLTFEDAWKGSRYEDLCVSSLQLHVQLDKKPKIQPAR